MRRVAQHSQTRPIFLTIKSPAGTAILMSLPCAWIAGSKVDPDWASFPRTVEHTRKPARHDRTAYVWGCGQQNNNNRLFVLSAPSPLPPHL